MSLQGSGGAAPSPAGSSPNGATPPGNTPTVEASPGPANEGAMPNPGLANEGVTPSGLSGGGTPPPQTPGEVPATTGAPCPASATLSAGDTTKTLTLGGVQRSFLVHAPPGYDGSAPLPVVFDFHGLGGNSNQQKNLSRWDDVADAEGFITVYPQGLENAWNAGLCCGNTGSDDVAFVRAIIDTLGNDACIDKRRVFASGCSNGGGMSFKLACEAADVIAGVAPVDFDCVDGAGCNACDPARPITMVQFRGTNDQLVPYAGNGPFVGAQANLTTWGGLNMCGGAPAALAQSAGCEAFPMCGAGAQTILCTVQNGTHCGSYGSFDIAEKAWAVLQNVTLP